MKIKKIGKILAGICMFTLLCGCAEKVNNPNEDGTEGSVESSTLPNPTNSSIVSSEDSSETADFTSREPEPQTVDIGNGMTLTGTLLDVSELKEFTIEPYISNVYLGEDEENFFDRLEIPELKDLYKRAQALIKRLSTTEFTPTFEAIGDGRTPARIKTADGKTFEEWGYTYESFYNSYLSAFTEETTEEIFQKNDFFFNYNGALFCEIVSTSSNAFEVHREYELISKSDTVVELRITVFEHDKDLKPAAEYFPELRDEYNVEQIDIKFVLTDDGWRMKLENL